jgi:hypothetical protein
MSVDIGAVATAGSTVLVGVLTWGQSRKSNRRSDFRAITDRLDRELRAERTQRRLLTSYVVDMIHWARRVEPTTAAGPVPEPPDELDLSPWQ